MVDNAEPIAEQQQALLTFTPLSRHEQAAELVEAIQRLSLAGSIEEVQEIVRSAARRIAGADGATFVLRDDGNCYYADEDAISPLWKGQRFPMEACISGWTMINRRTAVIEDIYADDRIPHDAYRETFVKSLAMIPIRTLDPVGAIGSYWASRHRPTEVEIEGLQALADSTAVALENVRVNEQLEKEGLETLERLALVAEYRDDTTQHHTERVARTARRLAEGLGLPGPQATLVGRAAPLHDIGKLAVPDSILLKAGKLTDTEFERIKEHTRAGAAILAGSTSEVLCLGEEIALTHHEWWDGNGYPDGMAGESIPISGRIVALADVFDALVHARPYKEAWDVGRAVEEVKSLAGRQFDPEVVEAFADIDAEELAADPEIAAR